MPRGVFERTTEYRRKLSRASKGHITSVETRKKISQSLIGNKNSVGKKLGENNTSWKGESAKVSTKHDWVRNHKGRPKYCIRCGRKGGRTFNYNWANIDHKYRRNLDDYIRLCSKCHRDYDVEFLNYKK